MPGHARLYLPEYAFHFVQRGNNREACFLRLELSVLSGVVVRSRITLWCLCSTYCLMTNHIHVLTRPAEKTLISNALKVVGSRYAQYIDKKFNRTGTLWEGRCRSCLVQIEKCFLTCCRYIELNPVAANMVKRPDEYNEVVMDAMPGGITAGW